MNRFKVFQSAHDDAIDAIHHFQNNNDCAEMRELVNWLLTTDANPYAFLPEEWAPSLNTAESFADLLHCIHHAVYDDGAITFVAVNDEPRIVFVNQYEDNFRDRVLTNQEKEIEKRTIFGKTSKYDVTVLDITPNEFGPLYDAFNLKDLQRCFSIDAGRLGIKFATDVYSKYACFTSNWVEQCADEIAKWASFYSKIKKDT